MSMKFKKDTKAKLTDLETRVAALEDAAESSSSSSSSNSESAGGS